VSALRTASVWFAALVLAVFLAAFLVTVTAFQLTSEDTGQRVLRRSVAASTGIDDAMPRIQSDLDRLSDSGDSGPLLVPGFPIPVTLTAEEAADLRGAELRDAILDRAASRLYDEGGSAWAAADPEADRHIERVSAAGAMDYGLGFVRDSTNNMFLVMTVLLAIIVLGTAGVLLVILPWDLRLLVTGGVALMAGLPPLAGAVALRFVFRTANDDGDPFVQALLDLGVDSMWVPIRNFFVLSSFGFLVVLIATALLWWTARQAPGGQTALDTMP
jgi:hypothetical protein